MTCSRALRWPLAFLATTSPREAPAPASRCAPALSTLPVVACAFEGGWAPWTATRSAGWVGCVEGIASLSSTKVWMCTTSRERRLLLRKNRATSPTSHLPRQRYPDASQPAPSARCDRHETRAGIVSLISFCLVRLSSRSGPPSEQTSLQRARSDVFALASRLDPLASSGDKRGRSKNLLFAVVNGTPQSDQTLLFFLAAQKTGLTDKAPLSQPQETLSLIAPGSPACAAIIPWLLWFPTCGVRFLQSRRSRRGGGVFTFVAVTRQSWRPCVCRLLCCRLACVPDPRLASGLLRRP